MRTDLHNRYEITEIYFEEAVPITEIHTHNTGIKKRLIAYAERFPDFGKQTECKEETGRKSFEIDKCLSFHLTHHTARNAGGWQASRRKIMV